MDTGAMYRAMALYLIRQGISPEEKEKMEEACREADISIVYEDGAQQVPLHGDNVNPYLRKSEVWYLTSCRSGNPLLRDRVE